MAQGNTRAREPRAEGTDASARRFGTSPAERRRLQALRNLRIVDTPSEDQYDGLVDVARRLATAPIAALSLVDERREWPKAVSGAPLQEVPREGSLGALVIDAEAPAVIVPDVAADARVASNPWVAQAGIRFYAAVPVSSVGGLRLGALAVMDTRPREDGTAVIEELEAVGRILNGQLARRRESVVGGALTGVIDFRGVVRRLSPEWEQALGYPIHEMVGRPNTDFVHPDDIEKTIAEVARLRAGERTDGFENRYVRKDGEARWFLWQAQEILGDDLIYASARDITELKRGEEALRGSEERFRSAFDEAPIGMAMIGLDAELRRVNGSLCETLGYSERELLALRHAELVHPDDLPGSQRTLAALLSGERRRARLEERFLRRDGSAVWALANFSTVHDGAGAAVGVLAQIVDLSERRRAEEAMFESREAAERANQAKSRFLARLSHELRTPLNAMMGFAQLLGLDELTDEQADSVERILRGGRHMLEVINDVLDISRVETGELAIQPNSVPAADVVEGVTSFLRPLADDRGVTVRVEVPDSRLHVAADRRRLNQVLVNLVSNALKYGPEASEVVVEVAPRKGAVEFTVSDTGPGIPPDRAERIFEPFERLPGHLHLDGTGLGLALSRNLVHAMGGAIGVRAGSPTEFWVTLPAAAPGPAPAAAEPDPEPVGAAAWCAPGSTCAVLYIEDSPANVAFVERALGLRPGVTLHSAADGATGLALAQEDPPDLVLLDFELPDMDGAQVLAELKSDPRTAPIPVIAVTADATRGLDERLLAAGAEAVEVKPLDVRRLLSRVDAALR